MKTYNKLIPHLIAPTLLLIAGFSVSEYSAFGTGNISSDPAQSSTVEVSVFSEPRTEVLVYFSNELSINKETTEAIFSDIEFNISESVLAGAAVFSNQLTADNSYNLYLHNNSAYQISEFITVNTKAEKNGRYLSNPEALRTALNAVAKQFNPKYHNFVLVINQETMDTVSKNLKKGLADFEIQQVIRLAGLNLDMRFSLVSIRNIETRNRKKTLATDKVLTNQKPVKVRPDNLPSNVEIYQQITLNSPAENLSFKNEFAKVGPLGFNLASSYHNLASPNSKLAGSSWTLKRTLIALTFFLLILGILAFLARHLRLEKRNQIVTLEKHVVTPLRLVKPGDIK